jgi:glycerol uptake facilitator protein
MNPYISEIVGTALLIIFGDGVVANVCLNKSKGQNSGWIVITVGWGLAVMIGAYTAAPYSGAHLNPAVTVGLASIGLFPWAKVPGYILAQIVGAMIGALVVYIAYLPHWKVTEDKDAKLAVFCTGPAIRNTVANLTTEIIGTAMLVFAVLSVPSAKNLVIGAGSAALATPFFAVFLVALIVVAVGLSLGGSTGYAINPARDLGPRIMHAILPIPGKRDSDWGYSLIPVIGPIIGGVLGALAYQALIG